MKIVRIYGGLGNQMFQYAFGKALENQGNKVLYDLSWFKKSHKRGTHRDFDMGCFNITLHKASKFNMLFTKTIKEKTENIYEPELLEHKGKTIYSGYFQTEQYFKNIRENLLQDFSLNCEMNDTNKEMLKKIKDTQSVSLHVRRGDYLKYPHLSSVCSLTYYQNAVNYILEHVKNPHFFLFSDDINWVKENIKIAAPFDVVDINDGKTAYCDMELMKNCKHNIIANSSFSWWGAWLNTNKDKIIIAPSKWFADNQKTEIIPDYFVKIDS